MLHSKSPRNTEGCTEKDIEKQLAKIAETQKDEAFDAISQDTLAENRAKGAKFANEVARKRIDAAWQTLEGKLSIISGKFLLSKLSEWCQKEFGVSLSARRIAREFQQYEIDEEVRKVISALEREG